MNRIHEKSFIGKANSVAMTEAGLERCKGLFSAMFENIA